MKKIYIIAIALLINTHATFGMSDMIWSYLATPTECAVRSFLQTTPPRYNLDTVMNRTNINDELKSMEPEKRMEVLNLATSLISQEIKSCNHDVVAGVSSLIRVFKGLEKEKGKSIRDYILSHENIANSLTGSDLSSIVVALSSAEPEKWLILFEPLMEIQKENPMALSSGVTPAIHKFKKIMSADCD